MCKIKILSTSLFIAVVILLISYPITTFFQKQKETVFFTQAETQLISQHLGHLLVDTLHEYAPYYDLDIVLTTIRRIEDNKESLKSLNICQHALFDFKCKIIEEETRQNLRTAEQFLINLAKQKNIIEVQKGKLYYEILQQGNGVKVDKESFPLLHFTETNLNQEVIRDTREDNEPIQIKLSETIIGFCRGVCGMQVGEKRKIYVHPDLAYGKLSRQQLAIFDVEIIGG